MQVPGQAPTPRKGRIQSIQSFSTLDGPGTRCVVFLQGCPVGCVFCQNPDSWAPEGGEEATVDELLRRLERFRPFLTRPGLTLSGGEPLYQPVFTLALARGARAAGWHVALDTAGWGPEEDFVRAAEAVDLVMFSIKHPLEPEKVALYDTRRAMANLRRLAALPVPVWLRYVLIAGWTDEPAALAALGELAAGLPNLERVEILPFNSLAQSKWARLGRENAFFRGAGCTVTEHDLRRAEEIVEEARRVPAGRR